ncbi:GEVED domain-containing protein [Lysobacter capsici]|uniref:GEVED domain-containing protein n=2 Tax=Lysobacter capsici TaxID=435897 RepID=UPI00287B68D5|nr:GEVED domain-containing protein [Lysobacter capsici]WND79810.1 GEVED domain-containing protein [Lysobacter capsici]WND85006.1 GEVED domain-containing protein [Lysobacter capsici]
MAIEARFQRPGHRIALLAASAGLAAALALWSSGAGAAQVHNATASGTIGFNSASTKPYPSTLTTTYTVTGANVQIVANNAPLTTLGGATSAMFTPTVPTTTTSVQLQTVGASCSFATTAATTAACPNIGTLTVSFSRPVTNPTLHFVGLGSVQSVTGDTVTITASRPVHTIASSVPAGATMTVLGGAVNLQTLGAGTSLDLVNTTYNGTSCTTITAPATQLAGCGSVRINGTVTSVTFNVGMSGRRTNFNATIGNNLGDDAYLVTTSVDEDFGDAPATYDAVEAASHILDGIRLGASVDVDNPNVLNTTPAVTPSPNAVAIGADNNGAAGDGADEDGLTTPLATLHTGLIGQAYTLTPSLSGSTAAGTVCGWIDFNRNNVFEAAEGVCNAVASGAASTALNWTVPIATTAGRSYVRLRATQGSQLTTATPTGRVDSGEVEDYMIEIKPVVRVIKQLNPTGATGRFDLGIGGTAFAIAAGHNGTTNFRTLYHNSASGAPDLAVAQNIATTAITTTVTEVPTAATTALYVSTYACVNGAGATVATGTGTSVNITLPVSVIGATANGRAQAVTCTFTNRLGTSALSITKADVPTTYTPGGSSTYTIQACNAAGADPAAGATITDTLPPGVTLSGPWTCAGTGGGTCSAASGGAAGGNTITLTAPALPAGGCVNITVPVNFSANPADY